MGAFNPPGRSVEGQPLTSRCNTPSCMHGGGDGPLLTQGRVSLIVLSLILEGIVIKIAMIALLLSLSKKTRRNGLRTEHRKPRPSGTAEGFESPKSVPTC